MIRKQKCSVTMWRVHGKPGNIQGNNGSITICPPQCFLVCRGDNGQGQRRPGNKTAVQPFLSLRALSSELLQALKLLKYQHANRAVLVTVAGVS